MWSGYVDVYGIKNYAGQIEVVEKMSKLAEVNVRVDGIESLYNVGGDWLCLLFSCLCLLLMTFRNSWDPDQARQNVKPDLDQNCLIFCWYS